MRTKDQERRERGRSGYELSLHAFERLNPDLTADGLAQRLESLRPALRELRAKYQQNRVGHQYSDEMRQAYLLAYFPPYEEMARRVLDLADIPLPPSTLDMSAAFLCAGPGSDASAFAGLLRDRRHSSSNAHIALFDLNTDKWAPIQQAVIASGALASIPANQIRSYQIDLRESSSVAAHKAIFTGCDLVMAQNFLNEVHDDRHSIESLRTVWSWLRPGARMVLVDLPYDAWHQVSRKLRRLLHDEFVPERTIWVNSEEFRFEGPPKLLEDHLFSREWSDTLQAKRKLKYGCLVMTKA